MNSHILINTFLIIVNLMMFVVTLVTGSPLVAIMNAVAVAVGVCGTVLLQNIMTRKHE